jgi:hypothetical protein
MKKFLLYLLALAALLAPCIADFSFWGLPWDREVIAVNTTNYPDIAYDMTHIPEQFVLWSHKQSMKYATIKPNLIIGEIRY